MKRLYHQLVHRWGEASDIIVYDGAAAAVPGTETIHVAIWDPDIHCEVSTFATLGMSERIMPSANYRTEIVLGCRGTIDAAKRRALAAMMANIAEYPFMHNRKIDWRERLANPGDIPAFPDCTQLLFAPVFGEPPFEWFPPPDQDVKVISVVPITPKENHILAEHGWQAFMDYWEESGVDIFAPRKD